MYEVKFICGKIETIKSRYLRSYIQMYKAKVYGYARIT